MRQSAWRVVPFFVVVLTCPSVGRAQGGPVQLTLQRAAQLAVENGLEANLAVMDVYKAQDLYQSAKGRFLPTLHAQSSFRRQIRGTEFKEAVDSRGRFSETTPALSIGVSGTLPTGTTYDLSAGSQILWTSMQKAIIAPQYLNGIEIGVSQPLLKGFGIRASTVERETARLNQDLAKKRVLHTEQDALRAVVIAYWNLYARMYALDAIGNVAKQLKAHRKEFDQVRGKKPTEVDDLLAQSQLGSYENDQAALHNARINAEAMLLRLLYNANHRAASMMRGVIPIDKPKFVPVRHEPAELLRTAMNRRPELAALRTQIQAQEIRVFEAERASLPQLDVYAIGGLYSFMGQQRDQVPDAITGEIPALPPDDISGRYGDAWGQLFTARLPKIEFGLRFEMPLSGAVRKGQARTMTAQLRRLKLKRDAMRAEIEVELRRVYLRLRNNERRFRKAIAVHESMRWRLEKIRKAFLAGDAPSTFYVFAGDILLRSAYVLSQAGADYMVSRAELESATGQLPSFLSVRSSLKKSRD